jgi:hydrogenase expression/formation protein HypC
MCLGIPGRVQSIDTDHPDLADVEVAGVTRKINVGILEEPARAGDWVLIQAGFAIEKIDEETAKMQLSLLNQYTGESAIAEETEFDWDTMTVSTDPHDGRAR